MQEIASQADNEVVVFPKNNKWNDIGVKQRKNLLVFCTL